MLLVPQVLINMRKKFFLLNEEINSERGNAATNKQDLIFSYVRSKGAVFTVLTLAALLMILQLAILKFRHIWNNCKSRQAAQCSCSGVNVYRMAILDKTGSFKPFGELSWEFPSFSGIVLFYDFILYIEALYIWCVTEQIVPAFRVTHIIPNTEENVCYFYIFRFFL